MGRTLALLLVMTAVAASPSLAQTSGGGRAGAGTSTGATSSGGTGGATAATTGRSTANPGATRVTRTRSRLLCPDSTLGDIDAAIRGDIACVP